jgi:hypothetical protein
MQAPIPIPKPMHMDADDRLGTTLDGEILGASPGAFEVVGEPARPAASFEAIDD